MKDVKIMAKLLSCLKWFFYCLLAFSVSHVLIDSVCSAITIVVTAQPTSGIAPLETQLICTVDPTTSIPTGYSMDFDDGSDVVHVESNQYSHTFTHTYSGGLFHPMCTVIKESGAYSTSDPAKVIVAKWKFMTDGEIDSSPAIGPDGTVYIGSDDNNIYAIDPETGLEKWRFLTGGEIQSSPAIGPDGSIYFGSLDNNFYALKPSGSLKWSYNIGNYVFSSPAISSDGRVIYVGASDNGIYAINTSSGTLKWRVMTGGKIISSPAIGNDGIEEVIYVGSLDRHVYALAADNGTTKWVFKTNREVYGSPAIGPDGKIYVGEVCTDEALTYNYKLFCLNIDGSKSWEFDGGTGFYSSPAIDADSKIYIGSWDGYLWVLNPDGTKNLSIRTNPPADINSSPAISIEIERNPVIYAGCKDGNFYAFHSQSVDKLLRQDWVFKTDDDILYSSPAIDQNGTIYIGSHDKCLYAINPGNIKLSESPWPMFHKSADHSGFSNSILIPDVISSSPSPNSIGVDIDTTEVQLNFAPDVKTSQILIDSFLLQKVTTEGNKVIQGQAIIKSNKYNNSGYNISVIFTPKATELPLEYNVKYQASVKYYPTENNTTLAETENTETTSYAWSFTTEAESEKDPNPSPDPDLSCFINSIWPNKN